MNRKTILKSIQEKFQLIAQWQQHHSYERANEYATQAKALIELLEIEDCGSTGGFDKNNPLTMYSDYDLLNRFYALAKKHGHKKYTKDLDIYSDKVTPWKLK